MKITSFKVRNYKAIKQAEVDFGAYNIVIGKNDVGKSSLLEAIDLLLNFDTPVKSGFHKHDEGNSIILQCEFDGLSDTLEKNLTEEYIEGDEFSITVRHESAGGRTPSSVYINDQELDSGAVKISDEELSKADSREHIQNQLPETVPVLAERDYDSETSLTRNSWLTRLMSPVFSSDTLDETKRGIREELEEQSEDIKISLNEVISSQHPHINNVKIDIGEVDLSKSISPDIKVRDDNLGKWMSLSERGSGVGNQFILSMMKSYADSQYGDGYSVLYEEPENSLHPSAVREMGKTLRDISEQGNQVIITTHSQSLINSHENGSLIVASNDDGEADFKVVDDDGFEAIEAIGAKNSDILQSDYVLYTEGASDAAVVEVICRNEFEDWSSLNVTIQPAGGGNLQHQLENMKQINRNSGILIDSDRETEGGALGEQSQILKDESERIDLDCRVLTRREIENYFHPDAIREALSVDETIDIGHYDDAEAILKQKCNYGDGKVQNARKIAECMYDESLDDEFSDLKTTVTGIFDGV
jgi:putative ATP-dependent endonuclease of OLD family